MIGVDERTAALERLLGVEDMGNALVIDAHALGRVFRKGARVGHNSGDPLAGVAGETEGERTARHVRRVEAGRERLRRGGEFLAVENVMNPRHRQRCGPCRSR